MTDDEFTKLAQAAYLDPFKATMAARGYPNLVESDAAVQRALKAVEILNGQKTAALAAIQPHVRMLSEQAVAALLEKSPPAGK